MGFHIVNVEEFQPRLLLQQLVRFVFPTALRSAAVVSAILLLLFLYSQRPGRVAYIAQPTAYSYHPSYDSSYGNSYRNYGTCNGSCCRPSDYDHMTPRVVPARERELSYQADLARRNEFRVIPLGTRRRDLLKKVLPTRTRKPTIEPTPAPRLLDYYPAAPRLLEYYPTELDQLRNKERGYCTREFDDPSDAQTKIRLLKLLPLAGNYVSSPIKCYFLNARHFANPMFWDQAKYTALSYTWGPAKEPSDVEDILINDHQVSVRRNLWAFLHTMRGLGIEGPFWIDALCIDQLNMDEKAQQLRLMPKIYAKADSVVVWLGDCTSTVATDLCRLQSSCDKMNLLRDKMSCIDKVKRHKKKSRDEAGYLLKPFHADYLDGLRYLVENTYWSRLWIVQEIFMAKQLRIYTGDRRWDLQELVRLQRKFEPKHPHDINWSNWDRIVGLKKQGRKLSKMHLHEALHHWSEQQCRDAHDKVYGLLGLVAKSEITIDLSIRIVDLFRQVLRLEQKKIYAKGYAYAKSFATQLLASLGLEHVEDARAIKANFLDAYRE